MQARSFEIAIQHSSFAIFKWLLYKCFKDYTLAEVSAWHVVEKGQDKVLLLETKSKCPRRNVLGLAKLSKLFDGKNSPIEQNGTEVSSDNQQSWLFINDSNKIKINIIIHACQWLSSRKLFYVWAVLPDSSYCRLKKLAKIINFLFFI